jgi:TonB dependent receptor/Protein of unknown function (DUF1275)
MSLALGIQNGAFQSTGGISVHTTYLTGLITGLITTEARKTISMARDPRQTLLYGIRGAFVAGGVVGAAVALHFREESLLGITALLIAIIVCHARGSAMAFEYFRNDVLDANDWFANHDDLPKSPLRQNDFGGVLGGPILKDNLFFFGSYEAVRVREPLVADTYVPTLTTRQSAPAAVQPLLNAFPRPTPNGLDFGNGTAAFTAGYSDPSSLDSSSLRVDYLPIRRLTFFARYSDAPSTIAQRGGGHFQTEYSNILHTMDRFQSLTLGGNQMITARLVNEVRFNYSRSRGESFLTLDNFGGAAPPPYSALYPPFASSNSGFFSFYGDFNPFGLNFDTGKIADNLQHQINVTDSLSKVIGTHQLKFGLDYRRLRPEENALTYQLEYEFGSLQAVLADSVAAAFIGSRTADVQLIISNWSLFAQDIWNVAHNVTITYGLRWEYNLAPTSPNGTLPFTVTGLDNLATAQLAPPGTPLWHSQKDDFAPRLGVAWRPRSNLVLRAGAGVFYDLGYSDVTDAMTAFPYAQDELIFGTSFPLSNSAAMPPPFTTSPPADYLAVVDPNHFLPRTYEWNAALEQSLGESNVLTFTYVGAGGRKLMRQNLYNAPNPEFSGEFDLMKNGATSDYDALQTQFRRHLSHGLQTLLSYTWGHSIDDVSSDVYFLSIPPGDSPESGERGPSDYDIRNTFSSAVSFDIPSPREGLAKPILGNWSTDSIIYARSAPPVNVVTGQDPFNTGFLSGAYGVTRPNLIPGVPPYLNEPNAPGGKIINAAAFSTPTTPAQGNLGRNALRGFGATQLDVTLRRKFQIMERLALQARGDLFNIFNHPNFGPQANYLSSPLFGQSTQMLAGSLGSGSQGGGLNPLYQIGGPRSVQLALKLEF